MKLRKNWKRFWTLNRHHAEGFTLVELIVVIAILAILGGVAVPAYSGYVKKANIGADQQLVADVKYALSLYAASNPNDIVVGSSIVLNQEGTDAAFSDTFAEKAMDAAFGDGWEQKLSLSYDGWTGSQIMLDALSHFLSWGTGDSADRTAALSGLLDGTINPIFENEVNTLYDLVETVATEIGAGANMSGMSLMQGAADATILESKTAADIANVWAESKWNSDVLMDGQGDSYTDEAIEEAKKNNSDLLNLAIANAGAIKARNTSYAIYMRDVLGYGEYYDVFANLTTSSSSVIPQDVVSFINDDEALAAFYEKNGMDDAAQEKFEEAVAEGFSYFEPDETTGISQAYQDGLAYYALMDTVNSVNNGENTNEETYWDDMEAAVDMYGAIARGEADTTSLNNAYSNSEFNVQDGSIVITLIITDMGIDMIVSPAVADPTN